MTSVDVFVTTFRRPHLLKHSLASFFESTDRTKTPYRLTVSVDSADPQTLQVLNSFSTRIDTLLVNRNNDGLAPSINAALASIFARNEYVAPEKRSELICMCQDDVLYQRAWLETLLARFFENETEHRLGFASGHDAVEHPTRLSFPNGIKLKDSIRATNMLGRSEYWASMFPIPALDPETGRERGKPGNGLGSSCDWWFLRNHPNSVQKTGRTNIVVPGLVTHLGHKESTWLNRELPESSQDKAAMEASK